MHCGFELLIIDNRFPFAISLIGLKPNPIDKLQFRIINN